MEPIKTGFRVCDAMTRKPIAVRPDTTAKEAAALMQEKDVGSLVVKDGETLSGYITEQGIVHKIVAKNRNPEKVRVKDIMITNVAVIEPSKDIFEALMKMRDLDIKQLPVVDKENNKLVGLLTLKDILKIQPQLFELLAEKFSLREEDRKPIFMAKQMEGTCDACGQYFNELYEKEGQFLCADCRKK